ncbi:MAG: helix-turn-helix domain-containing protein [Alphaproteobacteria bacterium]|nr:helix-turn-helix domain-containing protein [Alphaproteobacteria bacterium]
MIDGIEIEESSGNVYADLGMPDAEEMLIKCQLSIKIEEIIKSRRWTQQQAAEVLGMSQPKLSKMLRGQFRGISQARMIECLNLLGRDVTIAIGPPRRSRTHTTGRLKVVFA